MRLRIFAFLSVLTLIAGVPMGAAGQSCLLVDDRPIGSGSNSDRGILVRFDVATAAQETIGVTGADEIEAIAFDPFRNRLYAVDGGRFGTIDTETGTFDVVSETIGEGNGSEGIIPFADVDGLTVDPFTGTVYGSVRREDFPDLLIVINPRKGTAVKDAFGEGSDYVVIRSFDNLIDIDDLAYDSDRSILFGIANDAGRRDHLVRIDPSTGKVKNVGRLLRSSGSGVDNIEGLSFSFDGMLLGAMGGDAKKIYRIDPETARSERVGHLSGASDYESIECYLPTESNKIVGRVYNDANASEYHEDGEGGVFGVPVLMYRDENDNDRIDTDDHLLLTTLTDGDGTYDFKFYVRGDYLVRVDIGLLPDDAAISTRSAIEAFFDDFGQRLRDANFAVANLPSIFEVSGGGNAGIESEGSMATLLAQRLFTRRQDAHVRAALKAAPRPVPYAEHPHALYADGASVSKTGLGDVAQLIPAKGPLNSTAFVVTPGDLLGATNAFSVFAADYLRPEGRRVAAVFAATTALARPYDHSKTICDRLSGSRLENVGLIDAAGGSFVLTRTVHADGRVDYASSFIVYRSGDRFVVDSRFVPSEYAFSAPTSEVLNVQVWSLSPDMTASMVSDIVARLQAEAPVDLANSGAGKPGVPGVFVRDGSYKQGRLYLNLVNTAGARSVTFKGSVARSEIAAGRYQRDAYERTVSISNSGAVDLPLGALYDAELTLEYDGGEHFDKIYFADGAWSYQRGSSTSISYFETFPEPFAPPSPDRFVVERDAYLSGSVGDWAALFRYLKPGGRAVDLSRFGFLEFKANGRGTIRVVLEKAGIDTWDQYGYTFELEAAEKEYRVPMPAFKRVDGTGVFEPNDVTLLAFYVQPTNQTGARFDVNIRDVSFGGTTAVGAEDDETLPHQVVLDGNYPNPFNPATRIRFSLPSAQHVRLTVFDMLGRRVAVPVDEMLAAGSHAVPFDAAALASGTYIYHLETPNTTISKTMTLAK